MYRDNQNTIYYDQMTGIMYRLVPLQHQLLLRVPPPPYYAMNMPWCTGEFYGQPFYAAHQYPYQEMGHWQQHHHPGYWQQPQQHQWQAPSPASGPSQNHHGGRPEAEPHTTHYEHESSGRVVETRSMGIDQGHALIGPSDNTRGNKV